MDCALIYEGYVCYCAELQYERLYPIQTMLVVSRSHPLAKRKSVSYAELDGLDLAILSKECTPMQNNNTLRSLRASGAEPNSVMTTDNLNGCCSPPAREKRRYSSPAIPVSTKS